MGHLKIWSVILILLFAGVVWSMDIEIERFDRTLSVQGRPHMTVRNEDGRTKIQAEGNRVVVHVVKEVRHARNEEEARRLAEKVKVRVEQNGSDINVIAEYPKFHFGIELGSSPRVLVHFEITAPAESDLNVEISDGPLEVKGFHGTEQLHSADGDIQANNLSGKLNFSVADGNILAEDCAGSLSLHSSDGNARLTRFNGQVEASTADGKLFVDGILKSVEAKTSDGSMEIHLQPGSAMEKDWMIHSADGNVKLRLPASFSADLDVKTADGHITTQLPIAIVGSLSRDHITGKMNNGGHLLRIETSDGNVEISGE